MESDFRKANVALNSRTQNISDNAKGLNLQNKSKRIETCKGEEVQEKMRQKFNPRLSTLRLHHENVPNSTHVKNEIFSKIQVPSGAPFFVRLDGWRFQALFEKLNVEKPFDRSFAKCLVLAGKAIFQNSINPVLIYVASYEINALIVFGVPFSGRVEKIDSVLAGIVSSAFSLCALKNFGNL